MNETIDTTRLNAGQLVQRIMRAMDGVDRPESTAKYAEHIAAEILKLPADYWTSAAPTPPKDGLISLLSEIEPMLTDAQSDAESNPDCDPSVLVHFEQIRSQVRKALAGAGAVEQEVPQVSE